MIEYLDDIRAALIEHVKAPFEAAFPGVPLVFDNAPFDWGNPPERFVEVELEFYGGSQIGMNVAPRTRSHGYAYFTVHTREGFGSKWTLQALGWLLKRTEYAVLAGSGFRVVFKEADPEGSSSTKGWYSQTGKVMFRADPA